MTQPRPRGAAIASQRIPVCRATPAPFQLRSRQDLRRRNAKRPARAVPQPSPANWAGNSIILLVGKRLIFPLIQFAAVCPGPPCPNPLFPGSPGRGEPPRGARTAVSPRLGTQRTTLHTAPTPARDAMPGAGLGPKMWIWEISGRGMQPRLGFIPWLIPLIKAQELCLKPGPRGGSSLAVLRWFGGLGMGFGGDRGDRDGQGRAGDRGTLRFSAPRRCGASGSALSFGVTPNT